MTTIAGWYDVSPQMLDGLATPRPGDDSRRKLAERHFATMPKAWDATNSLTPEYVAWHRAILRSAPLSWRARWRWYDFREWLAQRIAPWAVKDITDA